MNKSSQSNRVQFGPTVGWSLLFGVTALAIVIGNSLAIVVLTRKKLLRKRTSYFLLSLAVADMTVGVFSVPTFIYQLISFWKGEVITHSTILNIVKAIDVFLWSCIHIHSYRDSAGEILCHLLALKTPYCDKKDVQFIHFMRLDSCCPVVKFVFFSQIRLDSTRSIFLVFDFYFFHIHALSVVNLPCHLDKSPCNASIF